MLRLREIKTVEADDTEPEWLLVTFEGKTDYADVTITLHVEPQKNDQAVLESARVVLRDTVAQLHREIIEDAARKP